MHIWTSKCPLKRRPIRETSGAALCSFHGVSPSPREAAIPGPCNRTWRCQPCLPSPVTRTTSDIPSCPGSASFSLESDGAGSSQTSL